MQELSIYYNKLVVAIFELIDLLDRTVNDSNQLNQLDEPQKVGLTFDLEYDDLSENDILNILDTIRTLLKAGSGEIKLISKKKGSLKLKLEVSGNMYKKLFFYTNLD